MLKVILLVAAIAATAGVGWPMVSSIAGGGQNEATRLVQAADRTQNKAQSLSQSFNDLIPPPEPTAPSPGRAQPQNREAQDSSDSTEDPTVTPTLTPGEHAVKDAMDFLSRVQQDLQPGTTEFLDAVNLLKSAWDPRYNHAVDEFRRFKQRVEHAADMSEEYVTIQQRLTNNISDPEVRARLRQVDEQERILIAQWLAQAADVLAQAEAIKRDLDDMNIRITKLELSATFAAVYEGFHEMPTALTTLNGELARFDQETERIYQVFGPKANQ